MMAHVRNCAILGTGVRDWSDMLFEKNGGTVGQLGRPVAGRAGYIIVNAAVRHAGVF